MKNNGNIMFNEIIINKDIRFIETQNALVLDIAIENLEILKTVFIVSDLQIDKNLRKNEEKIGVKVDVAEGEKCERCWMYSTTVGEDKENPTICHRCSQVIKE